MYCWASSDNGVDLLIKTFSNTMIAFVWCIMNLTHGWWVSIQSIVGTVSARSCSVSSLMWYQLARNLIPSIRLNAAADQYQNTVINKVTMLLRGNHKQAYHTHTTMNNISYYTLKFLGANLNDNSWEIRNGGPN